MLSITYFLSLGSRRQQRGAIPWCASYYNTSFLLALCSYATIGIQITTLLHFYILRYQFILIQRIHRKVEHSIDLLERTPSTNIQTQKRRIRRKKKTNIFLCSLSLIFFFSWLPLSVLNLGVKFGGFQLVRKTSLKCVNHL